MNREEALELLSQVRPLDQWRRHDAHSTYDPTNQATTAPAYPRFNHVAQQMSFPPVRACNIYLAAIVSRSNGERCFVGLPEVLKSYSIARINVNTNYFIPNILQLLFVLR